MGHVGAVVDSPAAASRVRQSLSAGLGSGVRALERRLGEATVVVAADPTSEIFELDGGSFAVLDGEIHARDIEGDASLGDLLESVLRDPAGGLRAFDATYGLTVVDAASRTVIVARDPVGNGSMFLAPDHPDGVVWSSRLRDLRAAVGATEPDWGAVDFFLSNGFIPSPWTAYEGLTRLGPGERVTVEAHLPGGAIRRDRYHEFVPTGAARADDRTEILRHHLPLAVHQRVGDIDATGLLLSGGVDSQMIAALVTREFGPPRTFTFEYLDYSGPINEGSRAKACADFIGAEHVLIPVEGTKLVEGLPGLLQSTAEPVARTIHTVLLDEVRDTGVNALLTGDGGDSLYLNGGDRKALSLHAVPRWMRRSLRLIPDGMSPRAGSNLPVPTSVKRVADGFRRAAERADSGLNVSLEAEFMPLSLRQSIYEDPLRALEGQRMLGDLIATERRRLEDLDAPDKLRVLEFRFDSADDLLRRNLDIAQVNGVRIRSPIFSKDLMERWMESPVPTGASLRQTSNEFTKQEIRELASEVLPDHLASAPKRGHSIPIHLWMRGQLQPWIRDRTSARELDRHGIFDPSAVRRLLDAHLDGRGQFGWALWSIAAVGVWLDELDAAGPGWLDGTS